MFRSLSTAVLLFLFALPGVALAQGTGTIAGQVLEDDGVTSVIGANVRVDGTALGGVTDLDGNYRIIGVPVGTFAVTASYTGYTSQTQTGVDVNAGYTRALNFTLGTASLGGEEGAVVEYRAPLITNSPGDNPRVVTGENLENLPIRGVAQTVALQGGIVNTEGSNELNIRGGRAEEVQYFVDGVRVSGAGGRLGVNQQAIEQQEVLIGTIPARYGDVQSGVISITTKTGREDFFGSIEGVTSQGLDSFGYNLGSVSLGGPIVPGRIGFFLSAEGQDTQDITPYGLDTFQLNDETFDRLQVNPQVIEVLNANRESRFVAVPSLLLGGPGRIGVGPNALVNIQALLRSGGVIGAMDSVRNGTLLSGVDFLTEDNFDRVRGKSDPLRDLTLNGNLNFTFGDVGLRLGAGYVTRQTQPFSFVNSFYNRGPITTQESENVRFYGTLRQRLSSTAFYQIQGEVQDFRRYQRPSEFSRDVEDVINYGDVSNERAELARRYYTLGLGGVPGVYGGTYAVDGGGASPGPFDPGTFNLPGNIGSTFYSKRREQQYRISASATAQVGVNQIEFGGEFQQETRRRFDLRAGSLATLVNDGEQVLGTPAFPNGITEYGQLTPEQLAGTQSNLVDPRFSFGYNFNGTEETSTDDQDIDGYFPASGARTNSNIAPYRPLYYAGYIQDKIEFDDLVVQLGLRVDVFDNNTLALRDIYAPTPIVRADSLGRTGVSIPAGIEDDYAVYFNASDVVVGFRDLDGNFYNNSGTRVNEAVVLETLRGGIRGTNERISTAFEPYKAQVTVMPRVGVSFPVTDRALFFASFNVTSQRPTEFAFAPISAYSGLTGQAQNVPNSQLRPERTTQYEIGFRRRLTDLSAISLSGFYRTQENKVTYRNLTSGFPAYSTFINQDFTTTQGAEVNFDLRRVNNVQLSANYTLSFAQGTGSDAQSTSSAAFRGEPIPRFLSPSDFDQRHTANVTVDYRLPEGGGPLVGGLRLFENFGINLLGQFGSGQRYTRQVFEGVRVGANFEPDVTGTVNGSTLPSTARLDLRVDRAFNLGFSDSRLRAYLQVQNLLDSRNTLAVYRGTGDAGNDGFPGTPAGISALNTTGRLFAYQNFASGPVNTDAGGLASGNSNVFYSAPRQVRLGFLFDF